MTKTRRSLLSVTAAGFVTALVTMASANSTFVVINEDGPGEGLNDATPVTPAGGNPATTLGAARLQVLQQMMSSLSCHFDSTVPIQVNVAFDSMQCDTQSAVLASAGPATAAKNFAGAPHPNTYYAGALANSIAHADLDPQNPDIFITFNSDLGGANCLPGTLWYYGVDGLADPLDIDMFTIAMHELTHGMGFLTFADMSTGAKFQGNDDAYMLNLSQLGATPSGYPVMTDAQRVVANTAGTNLVYSGPNLLAAYGAAASVYAPNPVQPGSSVSHTSYSRYPSELMSPFYVQPVHDLGRAAAMLADQGWAVRAQCGAPAVPAPATPPWALVLLASCTMLGAMAAAGRVSRGAPSRSPQRG